MNADLLIKNGMMLDPARGLHQISDVVVKNGKIIEMPLTDEIVAKRVIDADGCLVVPGLIDFHAHVFAQGSEPGIWADSAFLPQGVTTVVDAGSAGLASYENFIRTAVAFNQMKIFSFISVAVVGLTTIRYHENINPQYYDPEALKKTFEKHKGQLIALKVRQSKDIVGKLGLEPLKAAIKIAEEIGCPVAVHVTDPPCTLDEIASLLRPGDIFCHVFHGTGHTILGDDGKILPEIRKARQRGVIFDAANGKAHFSLDIARAGIAEGFLPDVISSDLSSLTLYYDYAFGLPYLMSKYLNLGVSLVDIIAACTETPAKLLGMQGHLGTLSPGAEADITVLKLAKRKTTFKDTFNKTFVGEELLIPQMTVLSGNIVYRQIDFNT